MYLQTVPQLGVNDLTATVAGWLVADGDRVAPGTAVAELETTKAVVEVAADTAGFIVFLAAKGDRLDVSAPLALIGEDIEALRREQAARQGAAQQRVEASSGSAMVTRKAEALAAQLGIPIADVVAQTNGLVREADVTRVHTARSCGTIVVPAAFATQAGRLPMGIWGCGQGALTMRESVDIVGTYQVVCLIADRPIAGPTKFGLPLLPDSLLAELATRNLAGVGLAVTSLAQRLLCCRRLQALGIEPLTIIHQQAWIAPSARVGKGCHVKARALIETRSVVGDSCQIDNGSVIAHDSTIGDGCHIAPGAILGSSITVGSGTIIGIGASVSSGVSIGANCIIAVGSSVTRDIPDNSVVEGLPGRIIGRRK